MEEIWKPVPSREGIYVSSLGRVQLPMREARMPKGGVRTYNPKPTYGVTTKSSKKAMHSYKGIYNRFYGIMKVHRLVCEAFHGIPPFPDAVVIHLDENAHNNRPENLKWGSQKENLNMPKIKKYHKSRTGENSPRAKWAKRKAQV